MSTAIDGFWLPKGIRDQFLTSDTEYTTISFRDGRPSTAIDGSVTARWPVIKLNDWPRLLGALESNRQGAPGGEIFWDQFKAALQVVGDRFREPRDPLRRMALETLPGYTGYSEAMIQVALNALELFAVDELPEAFVHNPSNRSRRFWEKMRGLPGWLRFYPDNFLDRVGSYMPGAWQRGLFNSMVPLDRVIGIGSGNVPGTALLISLLALATTLSGSRLPVVVVKNSRREPIFSPLVLRALEEANPQLVSTVAVLVWDYEDLEIQKILLDGAGSVIAAAADETISQIQTQIESLNRGHVTGGSAPSSSSPIRLYDHGHKVSFSTVGKEMLEHGLLDEKDGSSVLRIVTLLMALDSILWDQNGCLSARVHFVEGGGAGFYTAEEYADQLLGHLRALAAYLPRGNWPRQHLYDRFDRYKTLEATGQVQVLSGYEEEFLLIVDRRNYSPTTFAALVNDCQGRVIVVRPVSDILEVPSHYLKMISPGNLQSMSVAFGKLGDGLDERFFEFSGACGAAGVTAIRSAGRAAFPQLAYSWDGFIPLDLVRRRPPGRFTTIEFDDPYRQILDTYRRFVQSGVMLI